MQTKPESELSPRSKHRAQEPGRGHRAVKEEKTPRQEEEGKDCDRKDTQRYRISGGGKGPRGGGDEPKAECCHTCLSFPDQMYTGPGVGRSISRN